jgi:hypothetical protein
MLSKRRLSREDRRALVGAAGGRAGYRDALLNPLIELAVERSWRGMSKVIGPTQETAKSYQAEQTVPRTPRPVPPTLAPG